MPLLPRIMAFQPCVACLRGDTSTGVLLIGEPEWVEAVLLHLGVPVSEAKNAILSISAEMGCEPGKVFNGVQRYTIRCCETCASQGSMQVGPLDSDELIGYVQQGASS